MKTLIISLGGSIIIPKPNVVNIPFLKKFRSLILTFVKQGNRVVIITGGGKINKLYNQSAQKIAKIKNNDLDWLGIGLTKVNAELIRGIFGSHAHPKVITNPTKKIITPKKIIIACGWKPGCSSDRAAVIMAKNLKTKTIVNLTNIDYVYTADPKKDKTAKPIKQITWQEYCQLIGNKWTPRLNSPFDPIASQLAQKLKIQVAIIKGTNLPNFKKLLSGKKFKGTVIK